MPTDELKIIADSIIDQISGSEREELPTFVMTHYLLHLVGMEASVIRQRQNMILGIRTFGKLDRRVYLFGRLTGLAELKSYDKTACNAAMDLVREVYIKHEEDHIQDYLNNQNYCDLKFKDAMSAAKTTAQKYSIFEVAPWSRFEVACNSCARKLEDTMQMHGSTKGMRTTAGTSRKVHALLKGQRVIQIDQLLSVRVF